VGLVSLDERTNQPEPARRLSARIAYAGASDLDFNIIDADGTQVVGHGHYEVAPDGNGYETAFGEDRFNDGE